jgi:hypothetical protein
MPLQMFAIVASLAMAWVSDRTRIRWAVNCFQALMAIVGLLIILYAKPPGVRYFGYILQSLTL